MEPPSIWLLLGVGYTHSILGCPDVTIQYTEMLTDVKERHRHCIENGNISKCFDTGHPRALLKVNRPSHTEDIVVNVNLSRRPKFISFSSSTTVCRMTLSYIILLF